jgi:hemerythrin-like metal-binding protein
MIDIDLAKSWHRIFASHLTFALAGLEPFQTSPEDIQSPHTCQLGRWLDELESQYADSLAYRALVNQHRLFHEYAASMVERHAAGDLAGEAVIERDSFRPVSASIYAAIDAFAKEYEERQSVRDRVPDKPAPHATKVALRWKESMRLGIQAIDDQHREIISVLSRLAEKPDLDTRSEFVIDTIHSLESMMAGHFATEEAFMVRHGADAAYVIAHHQDHDHILEIINEINFDAIGHKHLPACEIYRKLLGAFLVDLTDFDQHLRKLISA